MWRVRQRWEWSRKGKEHIYVSDERYLSFFQLRISALFFLYYGRCCGRMSDLFEAEGNGAQAMRIKVCDRCDDNNSLLFI